MKIAFIISLYDGDRYGLFNATIARIKVLKEMNPDFQIDVFNLAGRVPQMVGKLKKILRMNTGIQSDFSDLDGLQCRNLYYPGLDMIGYFKQKVLKNFKTDYYEYASAYADHFKPYDLIACHYGKGPGQMAFELHRILNIPYTVTFHGNDVHVPPVEEDLLKRYKEMMIQSSANIFVSKGLMEKARMMVPLSDHFLVINNAVDPKVFLRNDGEDAQNLKKMLGLEGKVVGFVGGFAAYKNVLSLPGIFQTIKKGFKGKVSFIAIGEGNLGAELRNKFQEQNVDVAFPGRIGPVEMPLYYSILDVLVLPSKGEGQPMVLLEAMSCGVNCAGSTATGIPETIGNENCFDLEDPHFESKLGDRVVEILNTCETGKVRKNEAFDLLKNAVKEGNIYRDIIKDRKLAFTG